ncbi:MAG: hypothetical protein K2K91_12065 [Ruminococcus sp.]|nr:hypothetical protein [Ruminococcus sp.]
MGKFYSSEEYRRFIFSRNFKDGYAERLLDEFAGLAIDNPKLTEVNRVEDFTVIPVPSDVSTGDFMNLVRWLTQENMIFYGIATHKTNSYFVIPDTMNKWGDTVLIGFDNGTAGRWEIPVGLFSDENSAFSPMKENIFEYFEDSEHIKERYESCNDFLTKKSVHILVDYLK